MWWVIAQLLGVAAAVCVVSSPARAVGSYDNADIAEIALRYVRQPGGNACNDARKPGDSGGQCRAFVNCVVWMASSGSQNLGGSDYFQTFLSAGGQEVTGLGLDGLVKGDIVQVGQGVHTFIIVGRVAGNTFTVVDSNSDGHEVVMTYSRTVVLDQNNRAFRMGRIGSARADQGVSRLRGDFNADGTADVAILHRNPDGGMNVQILWGSKVNTPLAATQLVRTLPGSSGWSWDSSKPATGDFNADGTADVAILHRNPDGGMNVQILWGSKTTTPLSVNQHVKTLSASSGWSWDGSKAA